MTGREYFYTYIVPKITSVGASVVIVGALFKIMHWEGAAIMLQVGLLTEAFIFLLGVAAPIHPDAPRPDWSKVYPELAEGYTGPSHRAQPQEARDKELVAKMAALDKALANAITPEKLNDLGNGMKQLADNVAKMSQIADATVATNEYTKNIKLASNSLVEMNKSWQGTIAALSDMASASKDTKAYHTQIQNLTKNLTELNAVYEVELRNSSKYAKAMNEFYTGLSSALQNVSEASKDTQQFKAELAALTTNLTALNKVYGGMLAAMKS